MTIKIIIVTVLVSILAFRNHQLMGKLIFNPYMISHRKEWFRFISSGFIHADMIHLFVNMYVLYVFGGMVENFYSEAFDEKSVLYFILLYIGSLIVSIMPSYNKHKENYLYNALGASGAVSAVLFAFILFQPLTPLYFFGVIKLPGIVMGIAYLFFEYYMGKKGGDNINHDAHFWGAVFGVVFTIGLKPSIAMHFIEQLRAF
ncbi:MAG: rhomboid family intramembrane serine protease [Bacteroidia bacterium]